MAARVGAGRANEIARSTPPISEFSNGSANSKTEIATAAAPAGRNLPVKLFDYMASGKPIIATRGSPHPPLLNDGRALLSEPTPEGLADTIESTLNSPGEAQAAAQRALHYAAQHLKWEGFAQLVHDIYGAALQCDPTRRGREGSDSAGTFQ